MSKKKDDSSESILKKGGAGIEVLYIVANSNDAIHNVEP